MGFLSDLLGLNFLSRPTIKVVTRDAIAREWKQIDILRKKGGPSQLRQALIAADKTLDNALRDLFPGETMAERLKNARGTFDSDTYSKVWHAHKTRNALVHESGYDPSYRILEDSIDLLKYALVKLGLDL